MCLQEVEQGVVEGDRPRKQQSRQETNVLLIVFFLIGLLIQRIVITRSLLLVSTAFAF